MDQKYFMFPFSKMRTDNIIERKEKTNKQTISYKVQTGAKFNMNCIKAKIKQKRHQNYIHYNP